VKQKIGIFLTLAFDQFHQPSSIKPKIRIFLLEHQHSSVKPKIRVFLGGRAFDQFHQPSSVKLEIEIFSEPQP
jgi:hypothetical protein